MKNKIIFIIGCLVAAIGVSFYFFQTTEKQAETSTTTTQTDVAVDHSLDLPPAKVGEVFATVNQVRLASNDIKKYNEKDYKVEMKDIEEEIQLKKLNQNNRTPASSSESKSDK